MLAKGKAKRLSVYLTEDARSHGAATYLRLIELAHRRGIARASAHRGFSGFAPGEGFGVEGVEVRVNLPIKVDLIDTAEAIERIVPDVYMLVESGLVTIEDLEIVKDASAIEAEGRRRAESVTMKAKQMTIHISENDRYLGEPLYDAILKRFNSEEFAGATVFKALEGFGAHHQVHRDTIFTLHREAPIAIRMIDFEEKIAKAREILSQMMTHGAVVVNDVDVTFYGSSAMGKPASRSDEGRAAA